MKTEKYVQDMIDQVMDELPKAMKINNIINDPTSDQLVYLSVIMTLKNCVKTLPTFLEWSNQTLKEFEESQSFGDVIRQ